MRTVWLGTLFVLSTLVLSACNEDTNTTNTATTTLPTNAPAVGTKIADVVKSTAQPQPDSEYTEIAWEDLELPGQGMAEVMKKYESVLNSTPEGDKNENALLEKMQSELNNLPVNPALDGKKIKLPGYVTPLEVNNQDSQLKDFLLVPYFGACIHVPPPPLNQTLLVKPLTGKSLPMSEVYNPVWVYGTLKVETATTSLAQAGYQIIDAQVMPYEMDTTQPES